MAADGDPVTRSERGTGVRTGEQGGRGGFFRVWEANMMVEYYGFYFQFIFQYSSNSLWWIFWDFILDLFKKNNSHIMFGNIHLLMGKNWYFRKRITLW